MGKCNKNDKNLIFTVFSSDFFLFLGGGMKFPGKSAGQKLQTIEDCGLIILRLVFCHFLQEVKPHYCKGISINIFVL